MHQKSQGPLQSGALIWTRTHSSLNFFTCSGIAVLPQCHTDPPFPHFPHFPTIAWLAGTSFYNFADLWYQWHPPFPECKAEWISSEKKMKQWWSGSLQGAHSISDYVKYKTTNTRGKILNRGIWKCAQTTYIPPQRTFANLYLKCKTKIRIGFFGQTVKYLLQNDAYQQKESVLPRRQPWGKGLELAVPKDNCSLL